jgi:hypothetical protein
MVAYRNENAVVNCITHHINSVVQRLIIDEKTQGRGPDYDFVIKINFEGKQTFINIDFYFHPFIGRKNRNLLRECRDICQQHKTHKSEADYAVLQSHGL